MAFLGAAFSRYVNGKANVLGQIYTSAYNQLVRDMNGAASTLWQRDRAKAMLAQVDQVVQHLDAQTRAFVQKEVPSTYFALATNAKKDIRAMGIIVPDKFGQIHTEAVQTISDDAMLKFGQTMVGIKRSAQQFVQLAQQQAIRERIAVGQITGASADEIAKKVKGMIADQGITVLQDRGGKNWQLDTYANMLTRQVLANSGRSGISNTAIEYGLDLAQITSSNSQHAVCARWEGQIVSISGNTPGYPTLDDATADGLFHVGCVHSYTIVSGQSDSSIPADFKATLDDGTEVPVPDQKTYDAIKAMKYAPGDPSVHFIETDDGNKFPVKNGEIHRWVDDNELQSIIDTGKLSPTPENAALEAAGGYYGRPGHKDFSIIPDGGKTFLEDLQGDSSYTGNGMHHLVLDVSDIPAGVSVLTDPRTTGSVSLDGSIPMQNLSLVSSEGSKIFPGASIDWRGVTVQKK